MGARIAQRWADQCQWGHDGNRNTKQGKSVGQNLYKVMGRTWENPQWERAVQGWYDEVSDFSSSGIKKYKFNKGTGHYTQVVWAETKEVGCGYVSYALSQIIVCNYGIAGNMMNAPIYKIGPTGSDCPNGSNNGLCTW